MEMAGIKHRSDLLLEEEGDDADDLFGDAEDDGEAEDDAAEEGEGDEMARTGEWGGSEKDPFHKDRPNDDKVQKRHRSFGKREFKGGSPLAQSKGSTLVAHEGMLSQLKKKFPKKPSTLLSEDNIIEE